MNTLADPDFEPSDEQWAALLKEVGDDARQQEAALRKKYGPQYDLVMERARKKAQELMRKNKP